MHKIFIFLLFLPISHIQANEFKGLQFLINIITGEFMESKNRNPGIQPPNPEDISTVTGQTNFSFVDYVSHRERTVCFPHDIYDAQTNSDTDTGQKGKSIRVKCIPNATGNKTVQMVQSMKEVVTLLSPHGNSTKRSQPGKCVLVLFYTRSCPGSALMGPHFVALAKVFPNLTLAAIDAFKLYNLNTEFGIIGLPTLMLFHQGRPVVRFNDTQSTVNNFINFITRHTDLWPPSIQNAYVISEDFNGPLPSKVEYETDYYLYLAWAFIIFCAGYYFSKSRIYTQIVEMIQRNWRESEAQIE